MTIFILLVFSLNAHTFPLESITVAKDGSGDYSKIQQALDIARPGQIIYVKPGTYTEALWFKKAIRLIGADSTSCRLKPPEGATAAITVMDAKPDHNIRTIENLTIVGTGSHHKIQDVGLNLSDQEGRVIAKRVIKGSSADRSGIIQGSILGKIDGWDILFPEMARSLLAHDGRRKAVTLEFDAGPYARPKRLLTTPRRVPGRWPKGFILINSHITIQACHFEKLGGDALWIGGNESQCNVLKNRFLNNRGNGLVISWGAKANIKNNYFEANLNGIVIERNGTSPLVISNRSKDNRESGILFQQGAGGFAIANECMQNGRSGIRVTDHGTHPTLKENHSLKNNGAGICFQQSSSGTAIANTCWRNRLQGIYIINKGTYPMIFQNQCRSNQDSGIEVRYGAGGILEENHCESNWGYAIEIEGKNTLLQSNTFQNNQKGGAMVE